MNRIVCPKCRANNMPGQTNCFQCGSSLPPPDVLYRAEPSVQPIIQAGAFPTPPISRPARNPWPLVIAASAVLLLCVGLWLRIGVQRSSDRITGRSALSQAEELDQIRRAHGLSSTPSPTDTGDDGTRRELNRLREKYGINTASPRSPNDGSMPNGGGITFDQYRRQNPDPSNYQFR